jgi:1,4-dihydroxy-2-naphthoate octaprenyltransferase
MKSLPAPRSFGAWVLAARPATLAVAVATVLVGGAAAIAGGGVRVAPLVAALFGAILIQIGTNFANDVFDHEKGADNAERIGPTRAVNAGLLTPRDVRIGMVLAFGLATAIGAYLIALSGWAILAIGILSIASGIAYTGGPYPLGYNGLGDVFVFVFFGIIGVGGTAFVAHGSVPPAAWLAGIVVGALATNVLVVNNVRDHIGDVKAGKRTLVVRFGRAFGVAEYLAMLLLSAIAIALLAALGLASPLVLVTLLPLAIGLRLYATLRKSSDGPTLNATLVNTAKLMLGTTVVLAAALALGPMLS